MNSKTYHELKQKRFFVVRPEQIVLVEITTGHKAKTRSGCYHLTLPLKRQDGGNTVKELAKLKFQPTSAGYRLDRCFRTEDEKLNGTGNPLEAYLQHLDTASGKQHRITDAGVVPAWVLEGIREDVCNAFADMPSWKKGAHAADCHFMGTHGTIWLVGIEEVTS